MEQRNIDNFEGMQQNIFQKSNTNKLINHKNKSPQMNEN